MGHDADHSPPSSATVKNGGAILPILHTFSWSVINYLDRDNFTLHSSFTLACVITVKSLNIDCSFIHHIVLTSHQSEQVSTNTKQMHVNLLSSL
jgi:hypothetical protein